MKLCARKIFSGIDLSDGDEHELANHTLVGSPAWETIDDTDVDSSGFDTTFDVAHNGRIKKWDILQAEGSDELILVTDVAGYSLAVTRGWLGTDEETLSDEQLLTILNRSIQQMQIELVIDNLAGDGGQYELRLAKTDADGNGRWYPIDGGFAVYENDMQYGSVEAEADAVYSTTSQIVFLDADYTGNFPEEWFVQHPTQGTCHRITGVTLGDGGDGDGNDDTIVTIAPAASASFAGLDVRAMRTRLRIVLQPIPLDGGDFLLFRLRSLNRDCETNVEGTIYMYSAASVEATSFGSGPTMLNLMRILGESTWPMPTLWADLYGLSDHGKTDVADAVAGKIGGQYPL